MKELSHTLSAGIRVTLGLKRRLVSCPLWIENINQEVREVLNAIGSSKSFGLPL